MTRPELSARALRLGRLLHEAAGSATVGELRARAGGMSQTTAAAALTELEAAGLVERVGGSRGAPRLTGLGAVQFAGVDPVSAGEVVDAAAAIWPYTHAAFLRLYLAAIIARRHAGPSRPHLGFVAVGEPRTGKSALFAQVCHLLGLDADRHTRDLSLMAPGELTGRRGGGSSTTFAAAPYLSGPLVLIDEFDKADSRLRERAAKVLLQGRYRNVVEDTDLVVACAPMFAANVPTDVDDRFGHLRWAYRTRRSVLLDTGAVRSQLADLGDRLSRYYATHPAGELDLAQLTPPTDGVPNSRTLWDNLRDYLAPSHRDHDFPDERALDGLALGYAALRNVQADDEHGLTLAAIYALIDWHTCATTVAGLVDPSAGLPQLTLEPALRAYFADRADLASLEAAIAAQHAGAELRAAEVREHQHRLARASVDVVRGRGEFAEELRLAAAAIDGRKVPSAYKARAAGLREVLSKHRRSAQHLRRLDHLADAREWAAADLAAARQLADQVRAERVETERARIAAAAEEQRQRADHRRADREQQERIRAQRAADRAAAQAQLSALRAKLRDLEKLWRRVRNVPASSPLEELIQRGLVHYIQNTPPEPPERRSALRRMFAAPDPPPGQWVTEDGQSYPGYPRYCADLAAWGPTSRRVLAPALLSGYAREDALLSRTGGPARSHRIDAAELNAFARGPAARSLFGQQW